MLCKHGLWRVPSLHPWVLRMSNCLASALPADVFFCLQLSVAFLQSAGMSVRAFFCLSCSAMCKDSPWVATTHFLCLDLTANRTVTCYAPSSRLVFLASPYSFTDTKLGRLCGPDEPLPIKSPQIFLYFSLPPTKITSIWWLFHGLPFLTASYSIVKGIY